MKFVIVLLLSVVVAFNAPIAHADDMCPMPELGGPPPCLRPLVPLFACLDRNLDGTFTAHMGFDSQNLPCCDGVPTSERVLCIGDGNTFPGPGSPFENYFRFYRNYFTFTGAIPSQCLGDPPIDPSGLCPTDSPPDGFYCGQPIRYSAGMVPDAFTITWDGAPMTWTLRTFAAVPPFYYENSVTVSSSSTPSCTTDLPPVCNAGTYSPQCTGLQTDVALDGSGSVDPEGRPLTYQWSTSCDDPQAQLLDSSSVSATLRLFAPGLGLPAICTATLRVSDGFNTSECSAPVNVPACALDCFGQPNGPAVLDQCGVCGGNNACVDCLGVPFGGAVLDRCGVCAGDGQSCLGCDQSDISGDLVALDNSVLHQRNLINTIAKRLTKVDRSRQAKQLARRSRAAAQRLYADAWNATWSLPAVSVVCTNTAICSQSSNLITIQTVQKASNGMLKLSNSLISRLRRVDIQKVVTRYKRRTAAAYAQAIRDSRDIPPVQSSCS